MPIACSYAAGTMSDRAGASPPVARPASAAVGEGEAPSTDGAGRGEELAGLGIAGLSRRRIMVVLALVLLVWVALTFGRQFGAVGAAQARADALSAEVERRAAEVAALEAELALIQRPEYLRQQARAYGLGEPDEIPFALSPDAPPLAADAPGSAATRLGEVTSRPSPLETWLTVLFGPDPGR